MDVMERLSVGRLCWPLCRALISVVPWNSLHWIVMPPAESLSCVGDGMAVFHLSPASHFTKLLISDPCQLLKPMAAWKMTVGKMAVTDQQREKYRSPQLHRHPFTRLNDNFYMQTVHMRLLGFVKSQPSLS